MELMLGNSDVNLLEADRLEKTWSPDGIICEFLLKREPVLERLLQVRQDGWANTYGDAYFKQRERADNPGKEGGRMFYIMMLQIGDEMEASTNAFTKFSCLTKKMNILDLCMAPGGYTARALKYNPRAKAFGVTLPPANGGHPIIFSGSRVLQLDITTLAAEFGVGDPPVTHPEHASFLNTRPFFGKTFQLIFCDGQVLRTHQRAPYREKNEATRLGLSQLILALRHIRDGGTIVMLLHKLEAWNTVEFLYLFSKFSSVQLFKPIKKHTMKSSFYLIAKNVQPRADAAIEAVEMWKRVWWNITFGGEDGTGAPQTLPDEDHVKDVLANFGGELARLGRPILEIQETTLRESRFMKRFKAREQKTEGDLLN